MSSPNDRLTRILSELPPRPAPRSLESRVLQEIERRATRAWWMRSFAQWPAGMRAGFMVLCMALAALGFIVAGWAVDIFGALPGAGALSSPVARPILDHVTIAAQLWSALFGWIPPSWIHAALTAGTLLYVTLFALVALAYRWLYLGASRPMAQAGALLTSNGRYT